ncbi:hypothetical protein LINPERPRIM_LOCUS6698 [Linum perenne]
MPLQCKGFSSNLTHNSKSEKEIFWLSKIQIKR